MSHLPILPILLPLVAAIVLLIGRGLDARGKRAVSGASALAGGLLAVALLVTASDGAIRVYRLGAWPAPYGIVLVHDRLAAIMVALSAVLALAVVLAATAGTDERGAHFHALLQFQIAGLNGAFLTGDIFNLFVFFEILLLASYALLVHGGGLGRTRAGLAYVVLNLAGSALFLIALGLVYGTLGTLTMADVGVMLARTPPSDVPLVRTAMALLVGVFLLKAAVLPLGFWLPHVYSAALLPVAALFVIMTKVGIYALLRVSTQSLSAAPFTAGLLNPWSTWLAVGTIALGCIGLLSAQRLAVIAANLVVISSGILLLGFAPLTIGAIAAALYYLVHTTIVTATLFLLIDAIARRRAAVSDRLEKGPHPAGLAPLGGAFLVVAIAASGAPPLSGFLGKLMILQAVPVAGGGEGGAGVVWTALLVSSFVAVLVLARAASTIFWEPGTGGGPTLPMSVISARTDGLSAAVVVMVVASLSVTLAASPVAAYARATAVQLADRNAYVSSVLGPERGIMRERRP